MPHELTFGTNALEEHHELQLEEHHRINGGTTLVRIGLVHECSYKRQIKYSLQVPLEVILGHQLFYRNRDERGTISLFHSQHRGSLSLSHSDASPYDLPSFLLVFRRL
jgi:hypothetical protein